MDKRRRIERRAINEALRLLREGDEKAEEVVEELATIERFPLKKEDADGRDD